MNVETQLIWKAKNRSRYLKSEGRDPSYYVTIWISENENERFPLIETDPRQDIKAEKVERNLLRRKSERTKQMYLLLRRKKERKNEGNKWICCQEEIKKEGNKQTNVLLRFENERKKQINVTCCCMHAFREIFFDSKN